MYIIYITVLDWTDLIPYFLNYFESELLCRDGSFIKNVFVETRKNVGYSKLLNNPFKVEIVYIILMSTRNENNRFFEMNHRKVKANAKPITLAVPMGLH